MLRWRPTAPIGLPHVLTKDEWVKGYLFPKNSTIIGNAWAIQHNEEDYDQPERYIPERFLDNPCGVRPSVYAQVAKAGMRKNLYVWGGGRRLCPGEKLAYTTIGTLLSKLIWTYDIIPPSDGLDTNVETGWANKVMMNPVRFDLKLKLRSPGRKATMIQDMQRTNRLANSLLGEDD